MKRQLGPVATGKPSQKGKGRRRPGETRWRSAAAVERRAERGALRRAEAALRASGSVAEEPVEVPRAESLSFAEGLRLQSAPQLGAGLCGLQQPSAWRTANTVGCFVVCSQGL